VGDDAQATREAAQESALSSGGSDATPAAGIAPAVAACAPKTLSGFTPTWIPPGRQAGACTADQINGYFDACINQVGPACDAFKAKTSSNAACAACILPPANAMSAGPITKTAGVFEQNLGGCIAIVAPDSVDCAKDIEAREQCDLAACEAACVVANDPGSFSRYQACAAKAETGDCKAFAAKANCISSAGDALDKCVGFPSFEAGVKALATIFCGQ
jgi:hypothetical protein